MNGKPHLHVVPPTGVPNGVAQEAAHKGMDIAGLVKHFTGKPGFEGVEAPAMEAALRGVLNDHERALGTNVTLRRDSIDPAVIHPGKLREKLTYFAQRRQEEVTPNPEMVEKLRQRAKEVSTPRAQPDAKSKSHAARLWEESSTRQKLEFGVSVLLAGACFYDAYRRLNQVNTVDDKGQRHIDQANLVWGIANLAMGVASAVFAHYGYQAMKQSGALR